ncbi:MAG: SDR family NAD(P)-dependent oxidoreductase [Acidimicrobiales bacterium]|nr:SDR family NAD(P)-dependent oxidoreductase [Acidimicrobiales bacterium]
MELKDRVVVVTGGGAGIGEALVQAAAFEGARKVIVADLDGDKAVAVAKAVSGSAKQIDVSNEEEIIELVDSVEKKYGPIDLFCSNAGFVTSAGLEDTNERITNMWDVHVMAHVYAARAVLPQMVANKGGYLLNTASAAGLLTQIGSLAYSVTKGAAVSLAQWLSISHHHQGIRVSVLCPQAVRTDILANSPDTADGSEAEWEEGGVASSDGILEPDSVAQECVEAIREERFLVLPHQQVSDYMSHRSEDIDRWLSGMRRFQEKLYDGQSLPGDIFVSDI